MPRCKKGTTVFHGSTVQRTEFDMLVAIYAGIGGFSSLVGMEERLYHTAAKLRAKGDRSMGKAQQLGYGCRIPCIGIEGRAGVVLQLLGLGP